MYTRNKKGHNFLPSGKLPLFAQFIKERVNKKKLATAQRFHFYQFQARNFQPPWLIDSEIG